MKRLKLSSENYIYHGSFYKTNVLRPGIFYTKSEIFWDKYESNKFLYATTDKELAIQMGFASALMQIGIEVTQFITDNNTIKIQADREIGEVVVSKIGKIYCYTIPLTNEWVLNKNPLNNANGEYKTDRVISNIKKIEEIDISKWLIDYSVINIKQ